MLKKTKKINLIKFNMDKSIDEIESIIIDPSFYMADIDRENNI